MEVFVLLKNLMSLSPTPPPPCQESLLGHLNKKAFKNALFQKLLSRNGTFLNRIYY